MSSIHSSLLGRSPPPSNSWLEFFLKPTLVGAIGGVAYGGYSVSQGESSLWGIFFPFLTVLTSSAGLLGLRRWSVWHASHNQETSAADQAMGVATTLLNKTESEKIVRLISALELDINVLHAKYHQEELLPTFQASPGELRISIESPCIEDRLKNMQRKITHLKEMYEEHTKSFTNLEIQLFRLTEQLQKESEVEQKTDQFLSVEGGTLNSNQASFERRQDVLAELEDLQQKLEQIRIGSRDSSPAGSTHSRESTPSRTGFMSEKNLLEFPIKYRLF